MEENRNLTETQSTEGNFEDNNENDVIISQVSSNEEMEVKGQEDTGFKLGLFLKIVACALFIYAFGMYLWDNYIHYWWVNSCPQLLKNIIFWDILLTISWRVYKEKRAEEIRNNRK